MATLASTLYEKNLFYQQLSFKWRSFFHLKNLLRDVYSRSSISLSPKAKLVVALCVADLLDFVCGWLIYNSIQNNPELGQKIMKMISNYTITLLHWTHDLIIWIMGVPGGLKLNTPLNHFLGTRFIVILNLWHYFYSDFIAMYLDSLITILFSLLPFGLTLFLTAVHDFLKFLHLCLICFFVLTSRTVGLQISAIQSLARLFMGRKWNVLKKRVDSCDYDTNQLLVGTIMFTTLLFLLPTTGVYFVLFLLLRLMQFAVQLVLRTSAVLVNNVTVSAWNYFHSTLKDEPLTRLKLIQRFDVDGPRDEAGRVEAHIKFVLNGREHTVDELRSMINATPVESILEQLKQDNSWFRNDSSECNEQCFTHPMLDWLGTTPRNLY